MFKVIDAREANPKLGMQASRLKRALLVSTALIGIQAAPLAAQDDRFDGLFDQNWSDLANWAGLNPVNGAGDTATFQETLSGSTTVLVDGTFTVGGLVIEPDAGEAWTFNSATTGTLVFDNNGSAATITSTAHAGLPTTFTSNVILQLADDLNVSAVTGELNIASAIQSANGGASVDLDFNAAAGTTITVSGNITQPDGTVFVSASGEGNLILSGMNEVTNLYLAGGTTTLSSPGALGGFANIEINDATLDAGGNTFTATTFIGYDATFNNGTISSSGDVQLGSSTINGVLAGSGGLEVNGGGVVTLNGINTYTGDTTVSDGILSIGASQRISNSSNLVMDGGTLNLNGFTETVADFSGSGAVMTGGAGGRLNVNVAGSSTYSGTISGASSFLVTYFQKNGAGDLTLSGANTVSGTGAFVVNQGTVKVSGGNAISDGSIVEIGSAAVLDLLSNEKIGILISYMGGSVVLGSNTLTIGGEGSGLGVATSGNISGVGTLIYDAPSLATTFGQPLSYTGATLVLDGTMFISGSGSLASTELSVRNAGTLTVRNGGLASGTQLVVGTGGTVNLTDVAETIQLLTLEGGTVNTEQTLTVTSTSSSAVAMTGGTISGPLNVAGGLIVGPGVNTLSGTNTITGGITVVGGTLRLASDGAAGGAAGSITTTGSVIDYADGVNNATPINVNSNTTQLQVTTGTATQSGVISETGGPRPIKKIGDGTLILSAANTYTGTTTITAGTLTLDTPFAIQSTGGAGLVNVGGSGTLNLNVGASIGGLTGSGSVTLGSSDLEIAGTQDTAATTFTGTVSGAGQTLSRTGTGSTAFGNNASVTVDALSVNNAGASAVSGLYFRDFSTLTANSVTLAGASAVNYGVLSLTDGATSSATSYTINNGGRLITDGGALDTDAVITLTSGGAFEITGTGSETVDYITGATGSAVFFDAGTTLTFDYAGAATSATLNNVFGSGGDFVMDAANLTLNLTGSSSGDVANFDLQAGVVNISNNWSNAATNFTVASGATMNFLENDTIASLTGAGSVSVSTSEVLTIGGSTTDTFSGVISGGGGLRRSGTGTTILTGVNTYTGSTNIIGGTLSLTGSGALSGSSFINVDGGALVTDGGAFNAASIVTLFDGTVTFTGNETVATFGGVAGANVILDGATVTYSGSGLATLQNATISGTGGLEMNATSAEVYLNGINSYTGATTATVGTININGSIASSVVGIGTDGTMDVAADGFTGTPDVTNAGTLEIGTNTIASLSGAGTTTIDAGDTLTIDGGTSNFSGTLSGGAGLLVTGSSTAFNNDSGGSVQTALSVTEGATFINDSGAEVTAATTVADGGTVVANGGTFGAVDTQADTGSGVGTFEVAADTTVGGTFNNRGLVTTSGGSAVELTIGGGAAFNYLGGSIDATAADLTITADNIVVSGVTSTSGTVIYNGALQLLEGATLDLTSDLLGDLDIDAGASINIAASISANGFDITIDPEQAGPPPVVAGNMSVGAGNDLTDVGTLTNDGTLTVGAGASITAGVFNLNGTTMLEAGATLNGTANTLNIAGLTTLADGAGLNDAGAINVNAGGDVNFLASGFLNADDNNDYGLGEGVAILGIVRTVDGGSNTITVGDGDTDFLAVQGGGQLLIGETDTVTGDDLEVTSGVGGIIDLAAGATLNATNMNLGGTTTLADGATLSAEERIYITGTTTLTGSATLNADTDNTYGAVSRIVVNGTLETTGATADTITVGDGDTDYINIEMPGTLFIAAGDTMTGADLAIVNNGALNVDGTLTLTDTSILSLSNTGASAVVTNNGTLNVVAVLNAFDAIINNTGTIAGTSLSNSATLTNSGTGDIALTVTNNASGDFDNAGTISGAVVNNGDFDSTGGTIAALTHNSGTSDVLAGSITSLTVTGDGMTVAAGVTIGTLSQSGGNFSLVTTVSGTTSLSGGVFTNTGTLTGQTTVTAGTLNQNATAGNILNDGGTVAVAGNSGIIQHDSGTTTINLGTISALTVNGDGASSVGGTFGTVTVTNGTYAHGGTVTGFTWVNGGTLNNTGVLDATIVDGGILNSTTLVGGINIVSGAANITGGTVGSVVNAGTYVQSAATSGGISNTGTASVAGVVNGNIVNSGAGDFTITGMISGLDNIGHSGTGTFTVAGGNTTLDPGGIINSSGDFDINAGLLSATLFGNTGSGNLLVAAGATLDSGLTNGASAISTINGTVTGNVITGGDFTLTGSIGGTLANAAGGTAAVNGTVTGDVTNAGTMTLAATLGGNLNTGTSTTTTITGATTVAGDITVAGTFFADADLTFSNFTNNAAFPGAPYSVSASPMVISSGVTLNGDFTNNTRLGMENGSTINGAFTNNGILVADGTASFTGNVTSGAGTIMDVNDGATGDVIAIAGNAALNGRILMDADLTGATDTSDRLTVGGTVSGSPTFVFSNTGTELGQITDLDVVTYGTSTMTPTTEGLPVNGAVLYSFINNTSENAWQLQSGVNPAIGGLSSGLALTQSLLGSVVNRPTSPYVSGLAVDDGKDCGIGGWGRGTGGVARASGSTTTALGSYDSQITARYGGVQAGIDHSCFNGYYNGFDLSFGATAGYNFGSSMQPVYQFDPNTGLIDPTVLTSTNRTDFRQFYGGGYVGFAKGPVFGDLQYRYSHTEFDLANIVAPGAAGAPLGVENQTYTSTGHTVSGSLSYAKQIESVPGLTIVPTAGFSFTNLTTSDISFINDPTDPTDDGLLQIDPQNSRIGFLSVALAKTHILPDGASALNFFGTGTVYHDFAGPSTSRYYQSVDASGRPLGTPLTSTASNLGTFGELSLGVNYTKIFDSGAGAPRQFDASIRVDGRFSNTIQGVGVVGQVRFQF